MNDGYAILSFTYWPTRGTVQMFVDSYFLIIDTLLVA